MEGAARSVRHLEERGVRAAGAAEPADVVTRLVGLARAEAPLRRAMSAIAERLVASSAWERLGFARPRDYAVERAGISSRRLQELAHMDRGFRALPEIEAAYLSGRITWTKARLLVGVAEPGDERRWLALADRLTARELAREVRRVDARALERGGLETEEDGDEVGARETVFLTVTPPVRAKWHRARFLASQVSGSVVPPWAVAEALAAEALSALPLDAVAVRGLEAATESDRARTRVEERRAEAGSASGCATQGLATVDLANGGYVVPAAGPASGCAPHAPPARAPFLAALTEGLEAADAFELDSRLRRALVLEQRLHAEMGPLLLAVAQEGLHRAHGCTSVGLFAREWLGMSPRKAEALLRLERACQIAPVLREAYREGRLSWAKSHLLLPLFVLESSAPWHAHWVGWAERVTFRRLDEAVGLVLALGTLAPPDDSEEKAEDERCVESAQVSDPQARAPDTVWAERSHLFFNAPRDVARLFRATLATVQRRIERKSGRTSSESEALEATLEHAFESWKLPMARLRAEHRVFDRDGWRCTFPGCTSYRNLHGHHIEYRSMGGSDELSNLITLCAWHHQRGVHGATVRVTGRAPGRLRFELGLRPGLPPLARYRSGDRLLA